MIFAQAKAMGYAPTFFGVDGMDGILDMPGFDVSLAEGLVLMTPFCATVESSKSFVDAYVAAYGTKPNQFAADAYDGVYIVKGRSKGRLHRRHEQRRDLRRARFVMTSLKFTGLTGTDMTWNTEGQVSKAPDRLRRQGRPVRRRLIENLLLSQEILSLRRAAGETSPGGLRPDFYGGNEGAVLPLCPCFCHRQLPIPNEKTRCHSMEFLSYLISGISLGSVYAIIALGYTMVYGIAKMLNFAHGDVIMIGGYVSFCAMFYLGLPNIVASAMAVVGLHASSESSSSVLPYSPCAPADR